MSSKRVLDHLSGSPVRKDFLIKARTWVLTARYRELQAKLIDFLGTFSTPEVIDPLLEVTQLQNDNSVKALDVLANFHDSRIYQIATEGLSAQSGWLIAGASRVIAKYPEHAEQSMEILADNIYPAMNSNASEKAINGILVTMKSLKAGETVDFCSREVDVFMSTDDVGVKTSFLQVVFSFEVPNLDQDRKKALKSLIESVLKSSGLNNIYTKDFYTKKLNDKLKELDEAVIKK